MPGIKALEWHHVQNLFANPGPSGEHCVRYVTVEGKDADEASKALDKMVNPDAYAVALGPRAEGKGRWVWSLQGGDALAKAVPTT